MGCGARFAITLAAIVALLGVPAANTGDRSDAKAFEKAQATWTELDAAFDAAWATYMASTSGAPRS